MPCQSSKAALAQEKASAALCTSQLHKRIGKALTMAKQRYWTVQKKLMLQLGVSAEAHHAGRRQEIQCNF